MATEPVLFRRQQGHDLSFMTMTMTIMNNNKTRHWNTTVMLLLLLLVLFQFSICSGQEKVRCDPHVTVSTSLDGCVDEMH